jgi:Xaa-Pro dipeptidase
LGIAVDSSADILQSFSAAYSERAHQLQLKACAITLKIKDEAFAKIKEDILKEEPLDEYDHPAVHLPALPREGMVYDDPAIVAIGRTRITPTMGRRKKFIDHSPKGDLVLIDMWAKMMIPKAFMPTSPGWVMWAMFPKIFADRFSIVKNARNSAIAFLKKELPKRTVEGYEVDDAARKVIEKRAMANTSFTGPATTSRSMSRRTGRAPTWMTMNPTIPASLIDHTSFSIEPGIYAPDFGVRSETNVFVDGHNPIVVAGLQEEIIPILWKGNRLVELHEFMGEFVV